METKAKNKFLFLFTNEYPCSKTLEPYIEHELPYLAKSFDSVIVIPAHFGEIKKDIPNNVTVIDIFNPKYFKSGTINKITGLFSFIAFWINEKMRNDSVSELSIKNFLSDFKSYYNAIITGDAIENYCKENKIQMAECSFYSYWFFHPVITLSVLKKRGKIKRFVSRGHLGDLYLDQFPELSNFYNFKINNIDELFVISNHAKEYIKSIYPQFISKVKVAHLAVKDMGINPVPVNENVFVSCSTYSERKRVDLLVELLSGSPVKLTWIHFGYIPENVIERYKKLFKDSNSHVTAVFKGDVPNKEVMEFYKKNPVSGIINLSTSEGLPFSLIEANSFGIPVIATNINGTPDIATIKNGFLLPINFKKELFYDCIKKIVSDGVKLRKGARELFLELYNAERNYPELIKAL